MGVAYSARSIVFMFIRGLINFVVAIYISRLAVIISRKTDDPTVLVIAVGAAFLMLTGLFRIFGASYIAGVHLVLGIAEALRRNSRRVSTKDLMKSRLNSLFPPDRSPQQDSSRFRNATDNSAIPETSVFPHPDAISFAELKAKYSRPGLALYRPYPPRSLPKLRSRVGGLPALPAGTAWPRAVDDSGCISANTPLHFLAQVDLAEQPWLPPHFPSQGTLLFFGALCDGYFWGTKNDARVIYDATSSGVTTQPPENMPPVDGGYGRYQELFGDDDWLRCRIFPEWPLVGKRIETMPDGDAFEENSDRLPRYSGYAEALNDFRVEQIATAVGLDLSPLERRIDPDHRQLLDDPDFPWTPRFIALWGRMAQRDKSAAPSPEIAAWVAWADSQRSGERIDPGKAGEFKHFVHESGLSFLPTNKGREVLKRLVREAGGNSGLADCLPDELYRYAEREHRPVFNGMSGRSRKDKKIHWRIMFHQIGGHVPSTQSPMALDYDRICLMQLQSDWGSEMILCDVGEADYWIKPDDLSACDFSDVFADTRGH